MPLKSGKSKSTLGKNISELERSGYPPKQSEAIAFSKQKESKDSESAQKSDINGFTEVTGNPISRIGVFEYSGAQIGLPGLNPDEPYKVFRSEEALNNEETIDSFRLLPWTDEHSMLSGVPEDGLTDPAKKGIHGIIGENVYFEKPYLKANIKIFSSELADLINSGKKELSIGYRCIYELQSGEYNGEKYDIVQTNIKGNHLALVDEGRSGHDVSVLDHFKFTLDSKDLKMAREDGDIDKEKGDMSKPKDKAKDKKARDEESMTIEKLHEMVKKLQAKLGKGEDEFEDDLESEEINESENTTVDEGNPDAFVKKAKAVDEDEEGKKETEKKAEEEGDAKDEDMEKGETGRKEGAMDAKTIFKKVMNEISARDALAKNLAVHIGTFDHAKKSLSEVAEYGVKKLGLKCPQGKERYILAGYLAGAKPANMASAQDSKIPSSCIDAYLKGAK